MRRIILLLACTILCACSNQTTSSENNDVNACDLNCEVADMSEYTLLEDDHVFLETTYEEINTLLQDETFSGIIYFGYPGCPWCEEAVPIMNEVAITYNQSIYYVNKRSDVNLESNLEEETVSILSQQIELEKDDEGNPHLYVPEVIVVDAGTITSHHMGTLDGHDAHEREMSEEEITQLTTIYDEMFSILK